MIIAVEREAIHSDMLNDGDCKRIIVRKNCVALFLTGIEMLAFFGFIYLIACCGESPSSTMTDALTLYTLIGLGVIVLSWILMGAYVKWANERYDRMVDSFREKMAGS